MILGNPSWQFLPEVSTLSCVLGAWFGVLVKLVALSMSEVSDHLGLNEYLPIM